MKFKTWWGALVWWAYFSLLFFSNVGSPSGPSKIYFSHFSFLITMQYLYSDNIVNGTTIHMKLVL